MLGTRAFLLLVAELALTSSLAYVALAAGAALLSPALGLGLMGSCAVGFSGVLFGLKVVLSAEAAGWSSVAGITLPSKVGRGGGWSRVGSRALPTRALHLRGLAVRPSRSASPLEWPPCYSTPPSPGTHPFPPQSPPTHRNAQYVCWAELFLVQFMMPRASFVGHLAGILAGLAHVYLVRPCLLAGPGGTRAWWRATPRTHGSGRWGDGGTRPQGAQGVSGDQVAAWVWRKVCMFECGARGSGWRP